MNATFFLIRHSANALRDSFDFPISTAKASLPAPLRPATCRSNTCTVLKTHTKPIPKFDLSHDTHPPSHPMFHRHGTTVGVVVAAQGESLVSNPHLRGLPPVLLRGAKGHGHTEALRPAAASHRVELSAVGLFLHRDDEVGKAAWGGGGVDESIAVPRQNICTAYHTLLTRMGRNFTSLMRVRAQRRTIMFVRDGEAPLDEQCASISFCAYLVMPVLCKCLISLTDGALKTKVPSASLPRYPKHRTVPHLFQILYVYGFKYTICAKPTKWYGSGAIGLWTQAFIFSKVNWTSWDMVWQCLLAYDYRVM